MNRHPILNPAAWRGWGVAALLALGTSWASAQTAPNPPVPDDPAPPAAQTAPAAVGGIKSANIFEIAPVFHGARLFRLD